MQFSRNFKQILGSERLPWGQNSAEPPPPDQNPGSAAALHTPATDFAHFVSSVNGLNV